MALVPYNLLLAPSVDSPCKRSLNLKHNLEDVKMGPEKPRRHKGLVLTLLSTLAKFTHASIRAPVQMPLLSVRNLGAGIRHNFISPQRLAQATPSRDSAVINLKP